MASKREHHAARNGMEHGTGSKAPREYLMHVLVICQFYWGPILRSSPYQHEDYLEVVDTSYFQNISEEVTRLCGT